MDQPCVVAVGCDTQSARAVRQAWLHHGQRYLNTVLATSEHSGTSMSVEEITQRFALKEAVAKALAVRSDEPWAWRWIAVHKSPAGVEDHDGVPAGAQRWSVHVTDGALQTAQRQGIDQWRAWSWFCGHGVTASGYATVVALTGAKS